jgi:hypothetical protein
MTFGWKLVTTADGVDSANPVEGDLQIVNRKFVRIAEVDGRSALGEKVVQSVRVHFRWWRSEWFLDTRRGVPYLEELLGQRVSNATIRALIRREALTVADVAAVPEIVLNRNAVTRQTTIDFEVLTSEGEIVAIPDVPLGRV